MFDLFKAELIRFRSWAIACVIVHGMVLAFLGRVVDLAQQPWEVYLAFAGVQALAGLLLGLYQLGSYRRPNAWLNLLHRPLPHPRIALALTAASALLLLIGVLLPMLMLAAWQHWLTPRVLDARHLWLCVAGWNIAMLGWLSGACAMLLPRRSAIAVLVFLALLPAARATGVSAVVLQWLVMAFLLALMLAAFKPDLSAAPRGGKAILLAAPLQVALWLGLVMMGFGVELLWVAQGSHPNNLPEPVPGSAKEADNAEGRDLIRDGLLGSQIPEAALWREQAAISEVATFGASLREVPAWGELTNIAPMEFDDDRERVRYAFSHDAGRFIGYRLAERSRVPALGMEGDDRFPAPALPMGRDILFAGEKVLRFDEESRRVLTRMQLPEGEVATHLEFIGERAAVLGNRALYFFDARSFKSGDVPLPIQQRVPLPWAIGNLQRVDVLELLDGALVSFTVTRLRHNGDGPSFQQIVRVDETGVVTDVARRELATGYGPLFTWQTWWMSPVIHDGLMWLRGWMAPYQPGADITPPQKPMRVWVFAGILLLVSLLAALWHLRCTALTRGERIAWAVAAGVIGLPAFGALWLMAPPREIRG